MSELVENQYREWVYPLPVDDMREAIANGSYWEIGDPSLYWPLFWPHQRDADKLDILVAGCGTNLQAVIDEVEDTAQAKGNATGKALKIDANIVGNVESQHSQLFFCALG